MKAPFSVRVGFCHTVATLLFLTGQAYAADCLRWVKREDVGSYGQRVHHAMAYDSHRGVTVFFGGEIGNVGEQEYFNDTQEYNGRKWKPIVITSPEKPSPRSLHAMAYDPLRRKVVLYGGYNESDHTHGFGDVSDETWEYTSDGATGSWTLMPPTPRGPVSLAGPGMVWDASSGLVLLHGGTTVPYATEAAGLDDRTWSWNGTNWVKLLSGPSVWGLGMAFDSERSTAMIFGGFSRSVEADWTGEAWEKKPKGEWELIASGPPARGHPALAFHERRKRFVMVGGVGDSADNGEEAFEYIPGIGWLLMPRLPDGQGRAGAKMVYDSKRGVMVLTGGAGGGAPNGDDGGRYSDTWELWPALDLIMGFTNRTEAVCTTPTITVVAQGVGPFQYRWRRDRQYLTDDNHFSGTRTRVLTINGLLHSDAGKYDVEVTDSCVPQNVLISGTTTLTVVPNAEWVLRGGNGPPPRFNHAMAYDAGRHVTVLFGGRTNAAALYSFNDLWEWDGAGWTQRMQNTTTNGWTNILGNWRVTHKERPVQRAHHAMGYDSQRGRIVLFGGQARTPDGGIATLKDLWEWDGARWHFRTTNGPAPRFDCSMAYDQARERMVLLGGQIDGGTIADHKVVWEWDGNQWHTNLPSSGPVGSRAARMTYDRYRNAVVFGPTLAELGLFSHYWEFWDWNGTNWTLTTPVDYLKYPIQETLQNTRSGALAFDSNRRRSIWFGSIDHTNTLFFDGIEWTRLPKSSNSPPGRIFEAMAYDSHRQVTVMVGGALTPGGNIATNDVWELAAPDRPLINEQPVSQIRKPGEKAVFNVEAIGPGAFLGYQWYHDEIPVVGATTHTLTIVGVSDLDEGRYSVLVSSACGSIRSRNAVLLLERARGFLTSEDSTTLLWSPDPKLVLESADEVTGPWTTVPNLTIPFRFNPLGLREFFRQRQIP